MQLPTTRIILLVQVILLISVFSFARGFSNRILQVRQGLPTTSLYGAPDNPFLSMAKDFVSSLSGGDDISVNSNLDSTLLELAPSWQEVRSRLESLQTPEERGFRETLEKGYGGGSPMHKVRLYDESNKEDDVRVTFYRDSASWCPYCQKVWFALEEKRIPYKIEKINMNCYGDKPREFLRMQPNGQIPVAIIDGRVYGSSNDILAALEELFPKHKSLAVPKGQEMRARECFMLEQNHAGAWLGWLRSSGNNKSDQDRMIRAYQQIENALADSGGPFFLGKDVTVVDVQFLSFMERSCASLLYFKGFQLRVPKGAKTDFPRINQWFDALDKLPSYQLTKSDYYTHCWDLPPQLGGCGAAPEGERYRNAINGERSIDGTQGSWEIPLQPHNGGIEPDWEWAGDEETARKEAVERLSFNSEAIVAFAARGAGKVGVPPVMAQLADPNAVSSDGVQTGVSSILRAVSLALLEGVEKHDELMTKIAKTVAQEGGEAYADGVVASISYLRDRIGVPRDMKLPAARQLRAHLNWSLEKILKEQQI